MHDNTANTVALSSGDRIIIVGGGPAGAFFAIHLLSMGHDAGIKLQVTIVDKRFGMDDGGRVVEICGCNFCAGVITPRLQAGLSHYGIQLPGSVVCNCFSHIWIHGQWKNFPLKVPEHLQVLSVFRGTLPGRRPEGIKGFDAFLLEKAVDMGAVLVNAQATDISFNRDRLPRVAVTDESGRNNFIEGEFLGICTGVNVPPCNPSLFDAFARIQPQFVPPATRKALVFELSPGRAYLKKHMDRELYVIAAGSGGLELDHAVLVPKQDCLTVALMGASVDRASFPAAAKPLIRSFFSLDGIREILPGLTSENTPAVCVCTPVTTISPARFPYAHRMVFAGDALGSRLYRDGLYSAFAVTRGLAGTIIGRGVDDNSLAKACDAAALWLQRDNAHANRVMKVLQRALKSPFLSRVLYQAFATEMKLRSMDQWPVGQLLWQAGSGAEDFRSLFRTLVSRSVLGSMVRGGLKTVRNLATEWFFGLNWQRYGRYPAVIIQEKRNYIKASICRSLGVRLDHKPEMERMYAIKIRASADAIFQELGRFGTPGSPFLRLRFVDVNRVAGQANTEGAVVQYRLSFFPLAMDIYLRKRVKNKGLFYEPSQLFCRNGRLIFEVQPTRDGNHRLVVYTSFDYRRGTNPLTNVFWTCFRLIFPDFAHDVVWNHAVCMIKAEAEKVELEKSNHLPAQG